MSAAAEVKERLNIVDVVSPYVPSLKKAGKVYKGLCPFHTEKTPSFVVYESTQTWRCFGTCSEGGDVFSFVMKAEGYNFTEALKVLAAKAGVVLEKRTPQAEAADKQRKKLLEIVAVAAQFFHKQLLESPSAQFARDYVARRKLGKETISKFQLGYAPNQRDALKSALLKRGYAEKDLEAAGLLVTKENAPSIDRFRNRFVVPIRDIRGGVVGFGARALKDGFGPKYLNSPQSDIFNKSEVLFGLDVAKSAIREKNRVVIVEGYMDALQAHERGFANVVAQMGTALTEPQLKQLKRFTNTFVLALDADSAGDAATLRGINVARGVLSDAVVAVPSMRGTVQLEGKLNADIRVATMPLGKDPDDVLKTDPALWEKTIAEAQPLVDYYIHAITTDLDLNEAKGKSTAVQRIIPVIKEIPGAVEQAHYLQKLARLVKVDERTLREELERFSAATNAKPAQRQRFSSPPPPPPLPDNGETTTPAQRAAKSSTRLENRCLGTIIAKPELLSYVNRALYNVGIDVLAVSDFADSVNGALFLVVKQWTNSEAPTLKSLMSVVPEELHGHLATLVSLWHNQPAMPPDESLQKDLPKMIVRMRRLRLEETIKELNMLQIEALEAQDRALLAHCQADISHAKETLNELDKAHDSLSIMGRRRLEEKYLG